MEIGSPSECEVGGGRDRKKELGLECEARLPLVEGNPVGRELDRLKGSRDKLGDPDICVPTPKIPAKELVSVGYTEVVVQPDEVGLVIIERLRVTRRSRAHVEIECVKPVFVCGKAPEVLPDRHLRAESS